MCGIFIEDKKGNDKERVNNKWEKAIADRQWGKDLFLIEGLELIQDIDFEHSRQF